MSRKSAHDLLSAYGAVWCMRLGCVVANTECEMFGVGIADAVGFGIVSGRKRGIVVEAKTSRSDFLRDKKKWHRRYGAASDANFGFSDHYYIAPDGLLKPDEMPDGWGLLVMGDGDAYPRIAKRATYTKPDDSWWAHHFATTAKMLCASWLHHEHGGLGFIPTVIIPGGPDDLAKALAPLKDTDRSAHGSTEVYPQLELALGYVPGP
ncbi:MAG: hypothetical protein WC700_14520 [Gemmatimonadaceae bacterium]